VTTAAAAAAAAITATDYFGRWIESGETVSATAAGGLVWWSVGV